MAWPGLAAGRPNSRRHALHVVSFSAGRSLHFAPVACHAPSSDVARKWRWPTTFMGSSPQSKTQVPGWRRPLSGRRPRSSVCVWDTDRLAVLIRGATRGRIRRGCRTRVPPGAAWRERGGRRLFTQRRRTSDAQLHSVFFAEPLPALENRTRQCQTCFTHAKTRPRTFFVDGSTSRGARLTASRPTQCEWWRVGLGNFLVDVATKKAGAGVHGLRGCHQQVAAAAVYGHGRPGSRNKYGKTKYRYVPAGS